MLQDEINDLFRYIRNYQLKKKLKNILSGISFIYFNHLPGHIRYRKMSHDTYASYSDLFDDDDRPDSYDRPTTIKIVRNPHEDRVVLRNMRHELNEMKRGTVGRSRRSRRRSNNLYEEKVNAFRAQRAGFRVRRNHVIKTVVLQHGEPMPRNVFPNAYGDDRYDD